MCVYICVCKSRVNRWLLLQHYMVSHIFIFILIFWIFNCHHGDSKPGTLHISPSAVFELASPGAGNRSWVHRSPPRELCMVLQQFFLTITAPWPAFSARSHARQIRCIHIYSLYKKCGPEADRIAQNSNYRFSLHSIKATFGFVAHFYWVNKDKSSVHICAIKL